MELRKYQLSLNDNIESPYLLIVMSLIKSLVLFYYRRIKSKKIFLEYHWQHGRKKY